MDGLFIAFTISYMDIAIESNLLQSLWVPLGAVGERRESWMMIFFGSISTIDVRLQSIIVVLTDHKVNNEILCFSTQICLVDSLVRNDTPFFFVESRTGGEVDFPLVGCSFQRGGTKGKNMDIIFERQELLIILKIR